MAAAMTKAHGDTDPTETAEVVPTVDAELVANASLPELAATANRYHAEAEVSARSAVEAAWHAGQALLTAKSQLKHGEWLAWLKQTSLVRHEGLSSTCPGVNARSSAHLDSARSIDGGAQGDPRTDLDPKPKPDVPPQPVGAAEPNSDVSTGDQARIANNERARYLDAREEQVRPHTNGELADQPGSLKPHGILPDQPRDGQGKLNLRVRPRESF